MLFIKLILQIIYYNFIINFYQVHLDIFLIFILFDLFIIFMVKIVVI